MKDRTTRRVVVDWGHLALLLVICAVVIAYLLDARATSLKINNLLLVEPAAIIALILAAVVLPQCFRRKGPEDDAGPARSAERRGGNEGVSTCRYRMSRCPYKKNTKTKNQY